MAVNGTTAHSHPGWRWRSKTNHAPAANNAIPRICGRSAAPSAQSRNPPSESHAATLFEAPAARRLTVALGSPHAAPPARQEPHPLPPRPASAATPPGPGTPWSPRPTSERRPPRAANRGDLRPDVEQVLQGVRGVLAPRLDG